MSILKEVDVGEFLLNNPKYLPKWFSKHGTAALLEELKSYEKTTEPLKKISENVEPKASPKMSPLSGGRNSITTNIFKSYLEGQRQRKQSLAKKDRNKMLQLNEKELFMELIRDVASELDVNVLCHKILQNVSILTNSDRGSLFLTRGHKDNKFLVSKLFDVTETSTLAESIHTEEQEIKVPFGKGIAGHVALSKEIVNIKDAYEVG